MRQSGILLNGITRSSRVSPLQSPKHPMDHANKRDQSSTIAGSAPVPGVRAQRPAASGGDDDGVSWDAPPYGVMDGAPGDRDAAERHSPKRDHALEPRVTTTVAEASHGPR